MGEDGSTEVLYALAGFVDLFAGLVAEREAYGAFALCAECRAWDCHDACFPKELFAERDIVVVVCDLGEQEGGSIGDSGFDCFPWLQC